MLSGVFSLLTEVLRVFPESLSRVKDLNLGISLQMSICRYRRTLLRYTHPRSWTSATETSYHYPDIQRSSLNSNWLAYCNTS
jgi:hypothetical protein